MSTDHDRSRRSPCGATRTRGPVLITPSSVETGGVFIMDKHGRALGSSGSRPERSPENPTSSTTPANSMVGTIIPTHSPGPAPPRKKKKLPPPPTSPLQSLGSLVGNWVVIEWLEQSPSLTIHGPYEDYTEAYYQARYYRSSGLWCESVKSAYVVGNGKQGREE
jgi:hypothetical protein